MGAIGPGGEPKRESRKKAEEADTTGMKWVIGPHVRAHIIGYSGTDVTGARFPVEIFASGHRTGVIDGQRLQSLLFGGQLGTRLILCASAEEEQWHLHPWRCTRLLANQVVLSEGGIQMVRVPDLEWLDGFDQKRANQNTSVSYPFAASLAEGQGWSFGRPGPLKNLVKMIRVEHEDRPYTEKSPTP